VVYPHYLLVNNHHLLYLIYPSSGNDAIGLGAISAGSRFMAAYPITPASEIMEYMIDKPGPALAVNALTPA
jgi:TPP-dependent indolepyruvate ferredoxin oxidoreductase alpha subunit